MLFVVMIRRDAGCQSRIASNLGDPYVRVIKHPNPVYELQPERIQAVLRTGLPLLGWIANCIDPEMQVLEENIMALQHRIDRPLLGTVPYNSPPDLRVLSHFVDLSEVI